jgi:hypothetical protein
MNEQQAALGEQDDSASDDEIQAVAQELKERCTKASISVEDMKPCDLYSAEGFRGSG